VDERWEDQPHGDARDPDMNASPRGGATVEHDSPIRERNMRPDGEAIAGVREQPAMSHEASDALFRDEESRRFRTRWEQIQATFVDEPRQAVERADQLVKEVTSLLADVFTYEREQLEHQWHEDEDVSTEDLRLALRRYRSFFDRLLAV
jgi:hypothetical protein